MRAEASLLASSAASLSRKALVPDRAMVPSASVRSSRVHADAVVRDRQRPRLGIKGDRDREGAAALDQLRFGDRLVAELLAGVCGIGDELADKNLTVGIDRMNHQMQQARNVGLEALRFRGFARRGVGVGGQVWASSVVVATVVSCGERGERSRSSLIATPRLRLSPTPNCVAGRLGRFERSIRK